MIPEFVKAWDERKHFIEDHLKAKHPDDYKELVSWVVKMINPDKKYDLPDPDIIYEIDDGNYQGTLVYLTPETGYQPNEYYIVFVGYGSCSGCDTLEAVKSDSGSRMRSLTGTWGDYPPDEEAIKEYMTLALHIVQKFKKIGGWDDIA